MFIKYIANFLKNMEKKAQFVLEQKNIIASLETPEEIRAFCNNCPSTTGVDSDIFKRWEEIEIPLLETAEEARVFYNNCPWEMDVAVVKRLEEFILSEVPLLENVKKAKALYNNCTLYTRPDVMDKWEELTFSEISSLETKEEGAALLESCPRSMDVAVSLALSSL